jgi:YtcA family
MMRVPSPGPAFLIIANGLLSGCTVGGAPSFELFGAFFPAWMLCATVGIAGAVATRVVLTLPRLAEVIPYRLSVCTALGVIVALSVWLAFFR